MTYASAAVTAQGSKLEIETGSGGAVTLTAMTLTNPVILTKTSHGLENGDAVTLANFAGADAALINGLVRVVKNVTTDTFAVDVDLTGKTVTDNTDGATATPVALTEIKEVRTYSGFDGEASEVDVTHLNSAAKEFMLGLVDNGGFNADIAFLTGDTGQLALRASAVAGTKKNYKLTLSNAATASFAAYAKSVPISGGVDKAVDGSFKLKISGAVTWA